METENLTRLEKAELAIIAILSIVFLFVLKGHPVTASHAIFVGGFAVLMLMQSLIRDETLLILSRRKAKGVKIKLACVCAETTVGGTLVLVALCMAVFGSTRPVTVPGFVVAGGAIGTLLFGFYAKNYVIVFRKEKDHSRIIVK
jgi:hypothetical protein